MGCAFGLYGRNQRGPVSRQTGTLWCYFTDLRVDILKQTAPKVYTSVEIDADFSDTGETYLVELAVTHNPASMGTSMLQLRQAEGLCALSDRKLSPNSVLTAPKKPCSNLSTKRLLSLTHR